MNVDREEDRKGGKRMCESEDDCTVAQRSKAADTKTVHTTTLEKAHVQRRVYSAQLIEFI